MSDKPKQKSLRETLAEIVERQNKMDERLEEFEDKVDDAERAGDDAEYEVRKLREDIATGQSTADQIRELQDEVRYLRNRVDRMTMSGRREESA